MPAPIVIENLLKEAETPSDGTSRRTLYQDHAVKVVVIGSSGGQETSEQTETPIILELLTGDARITLDGDVKELSAGSWIYMEANLQHTIYTKSSVVLLRTALLGGRTK